MNSSILAVSGIPFCKSSWSLDALECSHQEAEVFASTQVACGSFFLILWRILDEGNLQFVCG